MKENWILIGRYIAVIITSLLLGLILGSMDLFAKTSIVGAKLTAAHIVRFLSYGGALVVFWLAVQRLAVILSLTPRWNSLQHVALPLGALIVVPTAYSILLIVLRPIMNAGAKNAYDWLFILATLAAAVWLIIAMFNQSSAITEMIIGKVEKNKADHQQ